MIYSHTQISQYLQCPRRYRYRYLDGWQEREDRASLLFGRAFERALAAYFHQRDPAAALWSEWARFRDLPLEYTRGDNWGRMGRQGVHLLEQFVRHNRIRIDQPSHLQVPIKRKLSGGDSFLAYIDALGCVDGTYSIIEWKTSTTAYPVEPAGILGLDPQLICYSWITGIEDVVLVAFLRKRLPEIQYLHSRISDRQRHEFGEQVEATLQDIRLGRFLPRNGIRFPQEACLSCPFIGFCLDQPNEAQRRLVRKPGWDRWNWIYELDA